MFFRLVVQAAQNDIIYLITFLLAPCRPTTGLPSQLGRIYSAPS